MPVPVASVIRLQSQVVLHTSASDFLTSTYAILVQHEASSYIILAHALTWLTSVNESLTSVPARNSKNRVEKTICAVTSTFQAPSTLSQGAGFWLTIWAHPSSGTAPQLEIVLSCLSGTLGDYPIFIWSPCNPSSLTTAWLTPRFTELAKWLLQCISPERVFSVFGPSPLVKTFSKCWSTYTSFIIEPEPFYSALFTYCTLDTFKEATHATWQPQGHVLRKAMVEDHEQTAWLCKEFAGESVYFPLTIKAARVEAGELIRKQQMWLYRIEDDLASICAVTRTSQYVSAITKVYTAPKWRKRGCAECLVRMVTYMLLTDCKKSKVVLYVGHQNNAQTVYDRVGFVGLCGREISEGVEDSLELGFHGTNRGHW